MTLIFIFVINIMNNQQLEDISQNPYEADTPTGMPNDNMPLPAYIKQVQREAQAAANAPQVEVEEPEVKINPTTQTTDIPLQEIPKQEIQVQDAEAPDVEEGGNGQYKIIPGGSAIFRLLQKPQYTIKPTENEKNEPGAWFFITTRYAESETLDEWKDFILQKYMCNADVKIDNDDYYTNLPINYVEVQPTEKSAKIWLNESEFPKLELTDVYIFRYGLICDIYDIKYRRFVNLPRGLVLYTADDNVIEQPTMNEDDVGLYFYTTRVLVEDYVLQAWKDMVLNVYYLKEDLTVAYGKDLPRDPKFAQKYKTTAQDADTGEQTLLTSYFDDTVIGKYLKNEKTTGELFITAEDIGKVAYYGSFTIKLEDLKYIHGIQAPLQ